MPLLKDLMSKPVISILPTKTIMDAAKLMKENDIESLVVAWGDQAVGILTEKDIVRRVVAEGLHYDTKVMEVMSRPLITIKADATPENAIDKMREHGIKRLPIEEKGKIIGIVVESDLL
jgi:CBS domain-containing protein